MGYSGRVTLIQKLLVFGLTLSPALFAVEKPTDNKATRPEVGLSLNMLLPNRLPDLETKFSGYALRFSYPVATDSLQVQFQYGTADVFNDFLTQVYLTELNYLYRTHTPYFSGYFLGGISLLHYRSAFRAPTKVGAQLGLAIVVSTAKSLNLQLELKTYFFNRMVTGIGGALVYLL